MTDCAVSKFSDCLNAGLDTVKNLIRDACLANRLKEVGIEHRKAGENIAFDYVDAIEAVHGWLNSPAHRDVLLNKDFTHIGTGAYGKHYTQDFIRAQLEEKRRQ